MMEIRDTSQLKPMGLPPCREGSQIKIDESPADFMYNWVRVLSPPCLRQAGENLKSGLLERGDLASWAEEVIFWSICVLAHRPNVPLPVVGSYRQVFSGETTPPRA